jgi:hypothetical protein
MKTRNTVPLSRRLDAELDSYVAAAKANASANRSLAAAIAIGAIGLGSLSLTPALSAEIVYTPTHQTIGKSSSERGFFTTLQVDLNNDGVPDFTLSAYNLLSFSSGDHVRHFLWAKGLQGNQILGVGHGAKAGVLGEVIGPVGANARSHFASSGAMANAISSFGYGGSLQTSSGYWLNATNRYLGIKFYIDGEIHYGWARLNAYAGHATLTGYAYETEPNKPIRALGGIYNVPPQESNAAPRKPATLGVLALGAAGRTAPAK